MQGLRRSVVRGLLPLSVLALFGASLRADTFDDGLALVPADSIGAFVVPSAKGLSDELTTALERVDRAEVLLVGRPLDLIKARLGVTVGLRDDGAVVGVIRQIAGTADPVPVLLVPVNDPALFRSGNFNAAADATTVTLPNGQGELSARDVVGAPIDGVARTWVALSRVPAGVEGLDVDPKRAAPLRARLGEKGTRLMARADCLMWLEGVAIAKSIAASHALAAASADAADLPADAAARAEQLSPEMATRVSDGVDIAALTIDIDALGILGRGLVRFRKESELGTLFAGGAEVDAAGIAKALADPLNGLPDQPFYGAIGIDIAGLGGLEPLRLILPGLLETLDPKVLAALDSLQSVAFGVFPSKLGVAQGGMLNDAALVLRMSDAETARALIRDAFLSLAGDVAGVRRVPRWESDRPVKDSGTADGFELVETPIPGVAPAPNAAMVAIVRTALFGSRGLHGLIRPFDGGVVLTFSQRPDVWRRAMAAATAVPAKGLGANAVMVAMREFMLDRPDLEGFLSMTALGRLTKQLAGLVPGASEVLPSLEFGPEPIGFALEIDTHEAESAFVVPSGVLGVVVDVMKRGGEGMRDEG